MNPFFQRRIIIQAIFVTLLLTLIARLFYMQLVDDRYVSHATNNVLRKIIVYPPRGIILDRNNHILSQNEPVYDLLVIPKDIKNLDTMLFCSLVGITKEKLIKDLKEAKYHSRVKPSVIEKQLSAQTYAKLQEHLFRFPGFFVQARTLRKYPNPTSPHILGYIGEVDEKMITKMNDGYRPGDYIGISGIEYSYEKSLRGVKGVKHIMVDVFNREQGKFDEGLKDTVAIPGEKLVTSIDAELQMYGEQLMNNKIGSIVAIEPSTGEILAFVSAPYFDPNLLVGRSRSENYSKLLKDPLKPLFIRPIQAQYPPGSIFKAVQALIAQQLGLVTPWQRFPCGGGYSIGRRKVKCTHVHTPQNMVESIQNSCNAYYCWIFKAMVDQNHNLTSEQGYNLWRDHIKKFSIGEKTGIDLPNELRGLLPSSNYYDNIYGAGRWKASNIISLSIGQGELGITPLQMANVMAIIANRGFYYRPHLVKAIGEKAVIKPEYAEKIFAGVDSKYYPIVIEGMSKVMTEGTAQYSKIKDIEVCGKTGTVQNPHGRDHSVFTAFAPKDNPKIAIAVVVENAGFGSTWAAPIASLMIEKYIKDTITRPKYFEDRILQANLIPSERDKIEKEEELRKKKAQALELAKKVQMVQDSINNNNTTTSPVEIIEEIETND